MRVTITLTPAEAIKKGLERRRKAHAKRVKEQKFIDDHRPWLDARSITMFLASAPGCGCRWCSKRSRPIRYCKNPECQVSLPAPASQGRPAIYCSARCRMDAKRRRDGVLTRDAWEDRQYGTFTERFEAEMHEKQALKLMTPKERKELRQAEDEAQRLGWREAKRKYRLKAGSIRNAPLKTDGT